jgi:Ankyrin repeats (3 copies)
LRDCFHKDKLASNCTSSPPQCDIDSYSVQIVRAVQTGDISTLKTILLKQHQQDSATAANIFNACNRFGESLLHMACRRGHFEIVQFLIKDAGVTIDRYDDYGRTPLHDAFWTSKPNFTIVDLLVRNCSPHLLLSYDIRGHTPFHYARSEHHTVWTTFLRQHRSILMQRISLYLSTVSMKLARQKAVTEGKPLETKVKVEEEIQEEHLSCNTSSGDKCVSEIDSSTTNQVEKLSSSSTTQADCSFVKEIVVPIPSHSVLFPSQQQTQQMLSNSSQAVVDEQILKPSNDMFLQQQQPFGSILQSPNFPSGTVQLLPLHLPQQQLELQKQQSPVSMPLMSNNLGFNNVQCSNLPLQLFPLYHHQQQGITNQSLANFQNLLLTHNILQQQQQQQLLNMSTMTPILVSNAANPALPLSQTIFIPHNQQHPVQSILTVNNSHTPAQQQSSNHSTQEEQIKS